MQSAWPRDPFFGEQALAYYLASRALLYKCVGDMNNDDPEIYLACYKEAATCSSEFSTLRSPLPEALQEKIKEIDEIAPQLQANDHCDDSLKITPTPLEHIELPKCAKA